MNQDQASHKVSVVINCHNGDSYLEEAIMSVYAQDFTSWELVLLDNASNDGTRDIAQKFDEKLRYFYNKELLPLGAARNLAVAQCSGEYIAFLDSDDLWLPQKLSKQLERIESFPPGDRYGFCYTGATRISHSGEDIISFFKERKTIEGEALLELMKDCFIPLSSCLIKRELYYESGRINEELNQVEEWDLWLRLAKHYKLAYVDQELTKIRFHSNNLSKDYLAQKEEMYFVLNSQVLGKEFESCRKNALKVLDIRFQIIDFLLAPRSGVLKKIYSLILLLLKCLKSPISAFQILITYLSLDLIKFFYIKYLKKY